MAWTAHEVHIPIWFQNLSEHLQSLLELLSFSYMGLKRGLTKFQVIFTINICDKKFQNMMDSQQVKSRPKGPNNRRPPKKKPDRNATSPLDENPPMVS